MVWQWPSLQPSVGKKTRWFECTYNSECFVCKKIVLVQKVCWTRFASKVESL
jgi:hypothetical protein